MRGARLALLVLGAVLAVQPVAKASSTDSIVIGQPTQRTLASGAESAVQVRLSAGDLVVGTIDQHAGSRVTLSVYDPAGDRVRRFSQRASGVMRFAFVAAATGAHRLEVRNWQKRSAAYELRVDQVLSIADQARAPQAAQPAAGDDLRAILRETTDGTSDTNGFWRKIEKEGGTPLIQPDGKQYRVTFLWRSTPQTRSVSVRWALRPQEPMDLVRLDATDIWFKSVTLPAGTRFTYKLVPDTPQVHGVPRDVSMMAVARADPLSPLRWSYVEHGDDYTDSSFVELPGAQSHREVELLPGVQPGKVERLQFVSKMLGNERDISIFVPHGYRADCGPYDLMVLLDGEAYTAWIPAPVILANLIAQQRIAPVIAVFVGNPTATSRNTELPANPQFADFLAQELLPWIRERYAVTSDSSRTTVGGSSFGGLAAAYAAFRHPETFGAVISQSGSFWWSPSRNFLDPDTYDAYSEPAWMVRKLATAPKLPLRFYLDAGWFEDGSGADILDTNRFFRDVLLARGYEVHYAEFAGGHEYVNWRQTLVDAVLALARSLPAGTTTGCAREQGALQ